MGGMSSTHAADRRDGLQRVGYTIVHENRAAPGADRFGDLLEDRRRRFLERHGAPENLRDRVEEVDLLVALGELVRGVLHLERRLQILSHDRAEEPRVALERRLRHGRWSRDDPGFARPGDPRDDHGAAG